MTPNRAHQTQRPARLAAVASAFALAIVLALASSDSALAQNAAPPADYTGRPKPQTVERCEVYQAQFDKKRKKYDADPNLPQEIREAIRLRRLGERLCNLGHTVEGQRVLKAAIERTKQKPEKVPQTAEGFDPSGKNSRHLR